MPDPRLPVLVPEDIPQQHRISRSLLNACWSAVRSVILNQSAGAVCRTLFPRDRQALELLDGIEQRAAVAGARTDTPGWAQELVGSAVAPFMMALPTSAAAQLIARGTRIALEGRGVVTVPGLAGLPVPAAWVGESGEIPMRQAPLSHGTLSPRKMAVLLSASGEMLRAAGAEQVFRSMLEAIAAVSLDSAYFSAAAGDAVTHAGLLAGLTPVTASSTALIDVLSALASAVGAGGSGEVVYIAGPGRAATAVLRSGEFTATVLASLALPENRIVAVDPLAIAHGAGLPEIDASSEATYHSADPASPISVAGAPNVVSAPVYSAFQTNLIVMRLLVPVAFCKTRPGAVAYADLP